MDVDKIQICGEESFGTGSSHIREKDGIWAVLCWLSILAYKNQDKQAGEKLVSVKDVVEAHWKQYGRNYYTRYDYECVDTDDANKLMAHVLEATKAAAARSTTFADNATGSTYMVKAADSFTYTDPVDRSVSANQGLRFIFEDGSRIIFRLSGTGSSGATIRLYIEQYTNDATQLDRKPAEALKPLISIALDLSQMEKLTGRANPTVIT